MDLTTLIQLLEEEKSAREQKTDKEEVQQGNHLFQPSKGVVWDEYKVN